MVLFVLFLVVLTGVAAAAIDVGSWYMMKRKAQATADAVALAAAADLPNAVLAVSDSSGYRTRNDWPGAVELTVSSESTGADTVTAEATTKAPGFFSRVFGIESVDIGARAVARHGSYTGWSTNLAPWTPTMDQLVWGQTLDLKVVPGDPVRAGQASARST